PEGAPARPAPALLPPNERRRAPDTVLVALQAAQAACEAAGREPAALPSVFASTYGDLAITDNVCATLARAPTEVSPTRFHNSVHNAAAGYWTIGTGAMEPATAISAGPGTFAMGLVEALAQLEAGADAVLLVAYDGPATGPLRDVLHSDGLLGVALVLVKPGANDRLRIALEGRGSGSATAPPADIAPGNAMAPALALLEAIATGTTGVTLGDGSHGLRIGLAHGRPTHHPGRDPGAQRGPADPRRRHPDPRPPAAGRRGRRRLHRWHRRLPGRPAGHRGPPWPAPWQGRGPAQRLRRGPGQGRDRGADHRRRRPARSLRPAAPAG